MKKYLYPVILLLSFHSVVVSQHDSTAYEKGLEAITLQSVKGQLDFLASDWTEGRGTGMRGEYIASDYIASIFSIYGLKPGGDQKWYYPTREERAKGMRAHPYDTYFQEITLVKHKPGELQQFTLQSGDLTYHLNHHTDFSIDPGQIAREINASIVFAGYGFVDEDNKYDDFRGLDVAGKIMIRLKGYPGHGDTASEAYQRLRPDGNYAMYYLQEEKDKIAARKGVVAIIDVDPGNDRSGGWVSNIPFRHKTEYYEGDNKLSTIYDYSCSLPGDSLSASPLRISLSKRIVSEIFKGSGFDAEAWEREVAMTMKSQAVKLKSKSAHIRTSVDSELIMARNVIGILEGEDTTEAIVVGAHYDHLGMFDGYIWNGADDNASGTVGMMSIAKACMATGEKPARTIIFAAWTGEEKGLLGSRYFVEHPCVPIEKIRFYLNYDMISRDAKDDSLGTACRMMYTAGKKFLEDNTMRFIDQYDINLDVSMRPSMSRGGGSDHSPFARKDVPWFYFMGGFHSDYHTPKDEVHKVNYHKLTGISKIGFLNIWALANMKEL